MWNICGQFPYNLPEYLLERQTNMGQQCCFLPWTSLTHSQTFFITRVCLLNNFIYFSPKEGNIPVEPTLLSSMPWILFSQSDLTGLWTGQTQATQPPLTSVTRDCGHCHLRKHNHSQGVAPCFQWRGLFVFYRPLRLWPWPTLKYLSTANHQQPTPWPLENEFACLWAGPSSIAQLKCQLDHRWISLCLLKYIRPTDP